MGIVISGPPVASAAPSGAAGGDLTGTYPDPTVKASVALTGTPTAATAAVGTSTTQLATTAFVGSTVVIDNIAALVKPTGAIAETMPRGRTTTLNPVSLSTGLMRLVPIYLPTGVVTSITFCSRNTAGSAMTNQWFAIYNQATRALLRQTVDDTSTAWAANTVKTLALTSTYTVTVAGIYQLGIMVAGTPPNLAGIDPLGVLNGIAPVVSGLASDAGLTTTAPNPYGATISASAGTPYAYVS